MIFQERVSVFARPAAILAVIFVLLVSVSCDTKKDDLTERPGARAGDTAPDFTLLDLEGKKVSLSEFKGYVVLLEFWATWCPPCRDTVPELVEIQNTFRDSKFVVLGISLDEGDDVKEVLSEFSREYMVNYPLLIADEAVTKDYSIISIPTSVLIDRKGKIADYMMGYRENYIEEISKRIKNLN